MAVFVGGSLGAGARHALSFIVADDIFAVFLCNAAASAILAVSLEAERYVHPHLRRFVAAGLCGGLSTFATFSKDNIFALQGGQYDIFAINILGSFIVCMGMFILINRIAAAYKKCKRKFEKTEAGR